MPIPDKSTTQALKALPNAKTHRAKCDTLNLPHSWRGTISRILYGHAVGLDKENEVRQRLGLAPITPPTITVPACPDCGSVHHARCNGNDGAVVVLAPGDTVTKRKPRRYSRIADMPVSMLARAVKERYAISLAS